VAYAQSIGCRQAVLVYPQAPAQPLDARAGDVRVRSLSFPLDGVLQAGGAHFLKELGEIQPISGSRLIQL
jgi:5-methylcytosine-specific restriction enzyme subunit McrC